MNEREINIHDLCWQPHPKADYILKDITSHFEEGGFYGILGPNGSGKTSLIRHLLRFLEDKEKHIHIEGKALASYSRKELATKLSFVPQNVNMDIHFSSYDVIAMGRTPYQKRFQDMTKADHEIIEHAMALTNAKPLRDKLFTNLSGGEAQRVLVARAIAQDTKYLILDEPISHLDIRYQIELMETLKRLNREEGKTIIAILHDLNLSAAYCKDIVLMKKGKIYDSGPVKQVLTKQNLKAVYEIDFEIYEWEDKTQMLFVPVTPYR